MSWVATQYRGIRIRMVLVEAGKRQPKGQKDRYQDASSLPVRQTIAHSPKAFPFILPRARHLHGVPTMNDQRAAGDCVVLCVVTRASWHQDAYAA